MPKRLKIFTVLPLVCAVTTFAAFGFTPTVAVAATTTVVYPGDMGSWAFDNRGAPTYAPGTNPTAITQMVNGPATPPIGTGSAQLATGNGTTGGDGAAELRNSAYAGTLLSSINALSYSTYQTVTSNNSQFVYIALEVNWNDGGSTNDDRIFFEPPYQTQATVLNTWQTWDALGGNWWANSGNNVPNGCGPGANVCSWATYLALHSGATLVNTETTLLGGVELRVGVASANDKFNGYADNFTIGTTTGGSKTFDFELAAPAATPLPAALPLFASGLGALGLLGWRKKRKANAAL